MGTKMHKIKKALQGSFALLALSFSLSSQASFVEADWKVVGDNDAILDTRTGYKLLDIGFTRGMSINDVEQATLLGGEFEGWRLPTYSEIQEIFYSTTGRYNRTHNYYVDFATNAAALHAVAGSNDSHYSYALFKYDATSANISSGDAAMMGVSMHRDRMHVNNSIVELDRGYSNSGVWLIADTNLANAVDVPTPPLLGALIPLIGFLASKRRSKKR